MSLILKNQRIYDFYQNHPQYDFERMNTFMVELLENFNEKMVPSLDQNFASKLTQQMIDLQTQLLKQQQDQQLDHYKQLTDFRKQYIEELRHAVHYHHDEKVQPLLSQQADLFMEKLDKWQKEHPVWQQSCNALKETLQRDISGLSSSSLNKEKLQECIQNMDDRLNQTLTSSQSLTTTLFTATESRLQENLKDQSTKIDKLTTLGSSQETMHQQVSDLLRKMDNSSSKGKVSESMLNHVLHSLYPMGEINAVGTTKETGDFTMVRDNKPKILFENKNYDKNVGQDEVQKFLRDVETQQCAGILLAQNYGIANKSNYEIHLYQGQVCVYLHQVQYSPEKIKIAVDIIDNLSQYIDSSGFQTEAIAVDREFLEQLNKEYQHFASQKIAQMKTIKEYSQKMISQLDEIKLPQLEQWLGKYFSQSFVKENVCKYCGFEAKSPGGLTSHMRSCVAAKKAISDDIPPEKPVKPNPFSYT